MTNTKIWIFAGAILIANASTQDQILGASSAQSDSSISLAFRQTGFKNLTTSCEFVTVSCQDCNAIFQRLTTSCEFVTVRCRDCNASLQRLSESINSVFKRLSDNLCRTNDQIYVEPTIKSTIKSNE